MIAQFVTKKSGLDEMLKDQVSKFSKKLGRRQTFTKIGIEDLYSFAR